jgi:8-oxo-dGTP pyrophosphatase MutT (NUDIX family)
MIQNADGKYLVVWNKRYGGFSFPGGRVEEGETTSEAAVREAREETHAEIQISSLVYEGEHGVVVESTRGSLVSVFAAQLVMGPVFGVEPGCPVTWWTREEFLKWSPFAEFYKRVFAALDASEK